MKPRHFLPVIGATLGLAVMACATLSKLNPQSPTATATLQATATVGAGTDLQLSNGPVIGSSQTTNNALNNRAPLLEALATEQYNSAELSRAGKTYTFTIELGDQQSLIWQTNWCTTTADILKQNLDHIHTEFVVNGETIDPSYVNLVQVQSGDLYCAYFIASVSGWPEGKTVLEINVTFTDKINDGMSDYEQGTHTYHYEVNFHQSLVPATRVPRATAPSG